MCKSCYFLFFVFLIACHPDVTPLADKLQRFDRQLESAPSSILDSLNQIDASALDKGDRAYYYLLQASAKDKNYQKITTDSTLRLAESYFYHTKNYYNLGRTRYYIAKYLYSTQPEKAYILLKEAEVNMKENFNSYSRTLGLIYSLLGTIQGRQDNHKESEKYYLLAIENFSKTQDSISILYTQKQLAWTFIFQKRYEEAQNLLLNIIKIVTIDDNISDIHLYTSTLNALNQCYQNTSNYNKALKISYKCIRHLEKNHLYIRSNYYSALITNLEQTNCNDSLKFYCEKMLINAKKENNLKNQVKGYKSLSEIEYKNNNYEKAYNLQNQYISLKDEYNLQLKFNEIIKLERKYNYSEKERLYYKAKNKNLWLLIFVLIITVIACLIILYSYWLHRKLKDRNRELAEQIREVEWGFTLAKELTIDNIRNNHELENILNRYVSSIPTSLFEEFHAKRHIQQQSYSQRLLLSLTNMNKEFAEKLKQKYPNLTSNEILLASMIRYEWDLNDISQVFQISLDAVQKRKSRLKTKINRKDPDIGNLEKYLADF